MPLRTSDTRRLRVVAALCAAVSMLLTSGCDRAPATPASGSVEGNDAARAHAAVVSTALSAAALNRDAARGLLGEADPRERLVALQLLLTTSDDPTQRRWLRARVRELQRAHPGDAMIAMARTSLCNDKSPDCDQADLAAWPGVEPDNAAAFAASLAQASGNDAAVDSVLAQMANGSRYDSHFTDALKDATTAMEGVSLPPLSADERNALASEGFGFSDTDRRQAYALTATLSSQVMPVSPLAGACRPPVSAARFAACRSVLMRMAMGSTLIERMVAISSLARLTAGTTEGAYWQEQQRRIRWIRSQTAGITADPIYRGLLLERGEADALIATLARRGRLNPPAGWTGPN